MTLPRVTHTYASLEVSPAAYREIAALLREARYHHVFHREPSGDIVIDMQGIALACPALFIPCGTCRHPKADHDDTLLAPKCLTCEREQQARVARNETASFVECYHTFTEAGNAGVPGSGHGAVSDGDVQPARSEGATAATRGIVSPTVDSGSAAQPAPAGTVASPATETVSQRHH